MTGYHLRRARTGGEPTAAYLAERERLGMPSQARQLSQQCPWCQAGPYQECTVRATGRRRTRSHHARSELVSQS